MSNFDHPGDLVLNEIHDMKEKILASQQVSILREAEREQWRRLVDSNIRSGTLACLWCLKTQYVKKLSVSFNKWKLFSALTEARRQREESPRRTASLALQNAIDVMNRLKPLDKKSSSSSSSSSSSYPQPSFKQLSSALQQADPEAKRRMLLDLSYDIMNRTSDTPPPPPPPPPPPHSTISAGAVPPPVSVTVEELAVIPEMSPISLDTTQRSLSSSKRPVAFSQPRLRLRHDLGGDFVRNILSNSSSSTATRSPARPQVRSTHRESYQGVRQQQQQQQQQQRQEEEEVRSLRESSGGRTSSLPPRYLQATNSFMKKRVSPEAAVRIRSQSASRRGSQEGLQKPQSSTPAASSSSGPFRRSYPSLGPNHSREMMAVGHSSDHLGVSHLEEGGRYPRHDESYPLPSPPIVSNGYIDAEMYEHEKAMGHHESHGYYRADPQDGDDAYAHSSNGYYHNGDSAHLDTSYSHFVQSRQQQHGGSGSSSRRSLSRQRSMVDKAQQRLLQGEFSTEIYGPTAWMKTLRR